MNPLKPNVKMNFPRHEFSKQNKDFLLEFLKVAKKNKSNSSCNLEEYEKLRTLCPLQDEMKTQLKEYIDHPDKVIDLTIDEITSNFEKNIENESNSPKTVESLPINETTIEDMTYAIKETLDNEKCLTDGIVNQLHSIDNLEGLLMSLSRELNFQEVSDFGKALISTNITNEFIIAFYIKYLLLEKANIEFTENLLSIFNQLSLKFPNILSEEISKYLLGFNEEYSCVLLQFLDKLNVNFKPKILKVFLSNYSKFQENYIPLTETLLTNQADQETISRTVEMISSVCDHYCTNKSFGKLLLHVVNSVGKHFQAVEMLLGHIIGSHKSIYRAKIQKSFDNYQQDSQIFTQSFR